MSELNQIQPAQAQIESVLHHVEQQQEQLAATLDECEREAALLLGEGEASAAATSTGPDAERERAYATADAVSRQLADIGRSLGGLVGEVNGLSHASGLIDDGGKGDADEADPVSQISAILASHLSTLTYIGASSEKLQTAIDDLEGRVRGVSGGAYSGVRRSTAASTASPARRSPFAR